MLMSKKKDNDQSESHGKSKGSNLSKHEMLCYKVIISGLMRRCNWKCGQEELGECHCEICREDLSVVDVIEVEK
jgi:hypothetical protein